MTVGFLGSFGHCVGMCGPLTVAFSLSQQSQETVAWQSSLCFHLLLNLGRIASYALVGGFLGGIGSIVIASGQLAGIGSDLRQGIAIITGLLLIWFGLAQIKPDWLPKLPIIHPLQGMLHERLAKVMTELSWQNNWWIPALLGSFWGLIPCGFLYVAQIKAAETGDFSLGVATMLAFGVGTMPMMLGVGLSTTRLSASQRSQLFRLGGVITLTIGCLTLLRSDAMIDYTGHGSLLLLILALLARPLSNFWSTPLRYRRLIGVGGYCLALAHTAHMLEHSLNWRLTAIGFMLPQHRVGIVAGMVALLCLTPAACTSFDKMQQFLGRYWRMLHLLSVPALVLATMHTVLLGSHYLGELGGGLPNQILALALSLLTLAVLLVRWLRRM